MPEAVERAVLLIVLLSAAFAATGAFLLGRMRRREEHRQLADAQYYSSQREFAETLQVTQNEGEAHALLKRHLERSLADSEIVVLNRNNSQNRLEAATPVDPSGPTRPDARRLLPRTSCLAVRLGRAHEQSVDDEPLLMCGLCSRASGRRACRPSSAAR